MTERFECFKFMPCRASSFCLPVAMPRPSAPRRSNIKPLYGPDAQAFEFNVALVSFSTTTTIALLELGQHLLSERVSVWGYGGTCEAEWEGDTS